MTEEKKDDLTSRKKKSNTFTHLFGRNPLWWVLTIIVILWLIYSR